MSGSTNDDTRLLEQYVRTGSDPAFRELVERHLPMVYSTALRVAAGDTHLAQDVAQTAFTELARNAASLGGTDSLGGWLYRVAYNLAAKAVRTESRRRARERIAMEMHDQNEGTAAAHWNQLAPVLDEALNQLDQRDRSAIVSRFLQAQDLRSIGATLGLSDDAAQKRIARALEKLRGFLTRRGLSFSAALLAATLDVGAQTPVPDGLAAAIAASSAGSAAPMAAKAAGLHSTSTKIAALLMVGAFAAAAAYVIQNPTSAPIPPPNPVAAQMATAAGPAGGSTRGVAGGREPVEIMAAAPAGATLAAVTGIAAQSASSQASDDPFKTPNRNSGNDTAPSATARLAAVSAGLGSVSLIPPPPQPQPGQPWAAPLAGSIHVDLLPVANGTFTMGSPVGEPGRRSDETQHQVTISQPFWLGKFEVTRQQFSALASAPPDSPIMALPVNISWMQAAAFCQALTEQERQAGRLPDGYEYRLPTEAEWEYACRAGTGTTYYSGSSKQDLARAAWYRDDLMDQTSATFVPDFRDQILLHAGGFKAPNAWGFYDMLGNAAEWCADIYAPYPKVAVTDPVGRLGASPAVAGVGLLQTVNFANQMGSGGNSTGVFHVMRGGDFARSPVECRAAARSLAELDSATGFRVALAPVLPGIVGHTALASWARMMPPVPTEKDIPRTPQLMETPDVLKGKTIVAIAQGRPLVLCSDGTLVEWRLNGPLDKRDQATPELVDTSGVLKGKTIIAMATGRLHTVVLCSDGTLVTWGDMALFGYTDAASVVIQTENLAEDQSKKLHLPSADSFLMVDHRLLFSKEPKWVPEHPAFTSTVIPTLVDTSGVLKGRQVIAISAADHHTLALCSDGTVLTWGVDAPFALAEDGSLEFPNGVRIASDPRDWPFFVHVVNTGALQNKKVVAIAAGQTHNLALGLDGSIAEWGVDVGYTTIPASAMPVMPLPVDSKVTPAPSVAGNTRGTARATPAPAPARGANPPARGAARGASNPPVVPVNNGGTAARLTVNPVVPSDSDPQYALDRRYAPDGYPAAGIYPPATKFWRYTDEGYLTNWLFRNGSVTPIAVDTSGVLRGKDIVSLSVGPDISLALTADGSVATWGRKYAGLFENSEDPQMSSYLHGLVVSPAGLQQGYHASPVLVDTAKELNQARVAAIAATEYNSLVYGVNGTLLAWGLTEYIPTDYVLHRLFLGTEAGAQPHTASDPAKHTMQNPALNGKAILMLSGANNKSPNLAGNLILYQEVPVPEPSPPAGQ